MYRIVQLKLYIFLRYSNIFKPLYKFCNTLIPGRAEQKNLRAVKNFGPVDISKCTHVNLEKIII